MASEPDDNPFARNSAWPRMPQAPFRIGGLPRRPSAAPEPEPEAAPATITPVFVRPLQGDPRPVVAASEPAPGSDMASAPTCSPLMSLGKYFWRWASSMA